MHLQHDMKVMDYVAIIRTLGTAKEKYLTLLESLERQTLPPKAIYVYIAEGYDLPKETIGKEVYIYVKKGMMAQRALPYTEVTSEYMLFLDDDLYLPDDTVENLFNYLLQNNADVISPDIYPNSSRSIKYEILMTLSARMCPRYRNDGWGYKVMRNGGYSYVKRPRADVLLSQTNAGACFLCRKQDFLKIKLDEECWIDAVPYALGDDQVIYYKMYLNGLKILTWYTHGVIHLDAGQNYVKEKKRSLIYSDFRFKTIFWYRFIYKLEKKYLARLYKILCISYTLIFSFLVSFFKFEWDILSVKYAAVKDALAWIYSGEYNDVNI